MLEERRQLKIVFGIFSGTVIIVMIIQFTAGYWGTIIPNKTVRAFLEYLFAALFDFPCIFVILYIHHKNYRPETITSRKSITYKQPVAHPTIKERPSLSSI